MLSGVESRSASGCLIMNDRARRHEPRKLDSYCCLRGRYGVQPTGSRSKHECAALQATPVRITATPVPPQLTREPTHRCGRPPLTV